jgi:hypothetical protein
MTDDNQTAKGQSASDRSAPEHYRPEWHYRPPTSDRGNYSAPRWIWGLVMDGVIARNEGLALLQIADQIRGKGELNREWIRLTRSGWAKLLQMTERGACDVRDSLLEKGYLQRREASEAPDATQDQRRTGFQYTYADPRAREHFDNIVEDADRESSSGSDPSPEPSPSSEPESSSEPGENGRSDIQGEGIREDIQEDIQKELPFQG